MSFIWFRLRRYALRGLNSSIWALNPCMIADLAIVPIEAGLISISSTILAHVVISIIVYKLVFPHHTAMPALSDIIT